MSKPVKSRSTYLSGILDDQLHYLTVTLNRYLRILQRNLLLKCYTGLVCFIAMPAAIAAPDIVIITSPMDEHAVIDNVTLVNIYRRKIRVNESGQAYIPVNLPAVHPLRRVFSQSLFKQSPEEMEIYWNEQYFHGISPPFVLGSSEAMIRFVKATKGSVGYVLDCQLDERVKVVLRLTIVQENSDITDQDCLDAVTPE